MYASLVTRELPPVSAKTNSNPPRASTTSPATRSTSPHVAGGKVGLGCQGNPLIAFSPRGSERCPPRNRPCTKYPSWAYHDAGSSRLVRVPSIIHGLCGLNPIADSSGEGGGGLDREAAGGN